MKDIIVSQHLRDLIVQRPKSFCGKRDISLLKKILLWM